MIKHFSDKLLKIWINWERYCVYGYWEDSILLRCHFFPNLICRFKAISIKLSTGFFFFLVETDILILKFSKGPNSTLELITKDLLESYHNQDSAVFCQD